MSARQPLERSAPWLGLLTAAVGWGASHQVGSDSLFDDCVHRGPVFVVLVGIVGLSIVIVGGLFAWSEWRDTATTRGRRFLGLLGALLSLLVGFGIVLQSIASLIIPSCAG